MNKKGSMMLPEETGNLILSVLVILLLVGLMVLVYNTVITQLDETQAEATRDLIKKTIQQMSEESLDSVEIIIESPKGWSIVSWPYEGFSYEGKKVPNICVENCVCVCEEDKDKEDLLENCESNGFCYELEGDFSLTLDGNVFQIPIDQPFDLKITQGEDSFTFSSKETNCNTFCLSLGKDYLSGEDSLDGNGGDCGSNQFECSGGCQYGSDLFCCCYGEKEEFTCKDYCISLGKGYLSGESSDDGVCEIGGEFEAPSDDNLWCCCYGNELGGSW